MRLINGSAIGNSGGIIRNLERRGRDEPLPDGAMIIVSHIPTLSKLVLLPSLVGNKPRRFSRDINAKGVAQAELIGIFFDLIYSNPGYAIPAPANRIKKYIDAFRDRFSDIGKTMRFPIRKTIAANIDSGWTIQGGARSDRSLLKSCGGN